MAGRKSCLNLAQDTCVYTSPPFSGCVFAGEDVAYKPQKFRISHFFVLILTLFRGPETIASEMTQNCRQFNDHLWFLALVINTFIRPFASPRSPFHRPP